MRLYCVTLTNEIVVWAGDEDTAKKLAKEHEPDERHFAIATHCEPIITGDKLPGKWTRSCLPYGRADDVTIRELLGEPSRANEE